MSLAMEFEAKNSHPRDGKSAAGQLLHSTEAKPVTSVPTPTPISRRPAIGISETERQARYVKGECFRCGEKYGPGHRCKPSSLQLLEVSEENVHEPAEGEEGVADVTEISFHAIMGMPNHSTLILPGFIKSSQVSILIDCGSTHNFVNDSLVTKIGLVTQEVVPFGVRIGNGDVIRCNRVCKDVSLSLADLHITQDLYPFVLGGADVVLGIQWLATLNTIQANWKTMFLKFQVNGKEYKLQGKRPDLRHSATFRHLTIEPYEVQFSGPTPPLVHSRLEDKSLVGQEELIRATDQGGGQPNGEQEHGEVGAVRE